MSRGRRVIRDETGAVVSVWAVLMATALTLLVGIAVDLTGQIGLNDFFRTGFLFDIQAAAWLSYQACSTSLGVR